MNKFIKILACALIALISAELFAASKKSIVCTTYPEYDWVINIIGADSKDFEVTLLQNKGTDLHSYQPSVKDIAKVSMCDLFIFVGGESDEWVENIIENPKNSKMKVINMMETLGDKVYEEEVVEGMQAEEEEGESEEEPEYDEHIWLSLRNAILLVNSISAEIQNLNPEKASVYKDNASKYTDKLSELDKEYKNVIGKADKNTILFADRFPFRYLAEDYGLNYYAAFVGCSAETEASFETVAFLSKKVDELNLGTVLVIEKSDSKIAKTVIASTKSKNQQILVMDSLQSITQKDIKNGRNYYSVMKNNLEILKNALD